MKTKTDLQITHKGWFGICPVYIAEMKKEAPVVCARNILLEPLMVISVAVFGICIFVISLFNPEYQPVWPIRITGELDKLKLPVFVTGPIITFENYEHWKETARQQFIESGLSENESIAVDAVGRICSNNHHFQRAQEENTYPINIYII